MKRIERGLIGFVFVLGVQLFATGINAAPAQPNAAEIVSELRQRAGQVAAESGNADIAVTRLSEDIKQRGYLEERLIESQSEILRSTDEGKNADKKSMIAMFAIQHYLWSILWRSRHGSDDSIVRDAVLPLVHDQNVSWQLRKFYLGKAHDYVREASGLKAGVYEKTRTALLEASKRIESNENEDSSLRAKALGIIGVTDLNDSERRRLILKHSRGSDRRLKREAFIVGSRVHNQNDEIVDEFLRQYESAQGLDSDSKGELQKAIWRIGKHGKAPTGKEYRETILRRLEAYEGRAEKSAAKETKELILDLKGKTEKGGK